MSLSKDHPFSFLWLDRQGNVSKVKVIAIVICIVVGGGLKGYCDYTPPHGPFVVNDELRMACSYDGKPMPDSSLIRELESFDAYRVKGVDKKEALRSAISKCGILSVELGINSGFCIPCYTAIVNEVYGK